MYQITQLDDSPKQKIKMLLDDNKSVTLIFEYKPNQLGWFFSFSYENQDYQNIRLTTAPNILRAYRNWLPFGIMCVTDDNLEPMNQDDFIFNYAKVYILTKEDVKTVEANWYVKV